MMALHSLRRDTRAALLHGTLDMLILRTLQRGPLRGHAIGQAILARSSAVPQVETGSLYPALQRLAQGNLGIWCDRGEPASQAHLHPKAKSSFSENKRDGAHW